MTFDMQLIHWPTVAAFAAFVAPLARPPWCVGITNHNTYRPDETQWRGVASMQSMRTFYVQKGWTSGPNLYLAAEAPNPADRGIWQMTPITHAGTHAGTCNRDHLGIESVGDFDARAPSAAQYDLLLAVNRVLIERWKLQVDKVNVHNECMPGRTCPGKHVTGAQIRADLAPAYARYRVVAPCAVFTSRSPDAPLANGPHDGQTRLAPGGIINVGQVQDGWLWISPNATDAPGIGFIPASYARPVS